MFMRFSPASVISSGGGGGAACAGGAGACTGVGKGTGVGTGAGVRVGTGVGCGAKGAAVAPLAAAATGVELAVAVPDAGSRVTVRSGKVMVAPPPGVDGGLVCSFGGAEVAGVGDGTLCVGGGGAAAAGGGVAGVSGPAPEGPAAPGSVGLPGTTTGLAREAADGPVALAAGVVLPGTGPAGAWPLRDGALDRAAAACCRAESCLLGSLVAAGGVVCCCCGGGGLGGFLFAAESVATGCGSAALLGTPAAAAAEALNFARVLRYSCTRWG